MSLTAFMTLDLPKATSDQREAFYKSLRGSRWRKIEGVTTAWAKTFTEGAVESAVSKAVVQDLEAAKSASGGAYRADYLISPSALRSAS